MKKFIGLTLALAMLTSCAVGCGDSDDDSSKSSSSSSVSESEGTSAGEDDTTEPVTTEAVTTTAEDVTTTAVTTTEAPDVEPETTTADPGSNSLPSVTIEPNDPIPVNGEIAGKWEAEKIIEDGMDISDEINIPINWLVQFEFTSDGVAVLNSAFNEEEPMKGTWVQNGNTVTVDIDDEAIDFELKDDRLVSDDDGALIYLMKVEEFSEYDLSALFGGIDIADE